MRWLWPEPNPRVGRLSESHSVVPCFFWCVFSELIGCIHNIIHNIPSIYNIIIIYSILLLSAFCLGAVPSPLSVVAIMGESRRLGPADRFHKGSDRATLGLSVIQAVLQWLSSFTAQKRPLGNKQKDTTVCQRDSVHKIGWQRTPAREQWLLNPYCKLLFPIHLPLHFLLFLH